MPSKVDRFRYWREPKKGEKYGPTDFQKGVFIDEMPYEVRKKYAHLHDLDIVLLLGGARSGKSSASAARCVKVARTYPGARVFVGSMNYPHIENAVLPDYRALFSVDGGEWNHPSVIRKPSKGHKHLKIRTADGKGISTISFVNLKEYWKTLGTAADIWHLEEPELLSDEEALETIISRLSNDAVPFKQVMLTANPVAEGLDWLIKWFELEQFEEGYKGERHPIGEPCNCHCCGDCEDKNKTVPYIDGVCPECGKIKLTQCPGGQYKKRVIFSDSSMNPHLRENFKRDFISSVSADKQKALGQGLVFRRRRGAMYTSYSPNNIYLENEPLDPNLPMVWTHDFNKMPMCSVILQEVLRDGFVHINVIDEIVERDAGPEKVARKFIERYHGKFEGLIKIYGDPTAFNGPQTSQQLDRFRVLEKMLNDAGFMTELKAYPTIYQRSKRYDSVNHMLAAIKPDGSVINRIHINPSLRWLPLSLEKTVWAQNGKQECEKIDHYYRDKSKPGEILALTHPAAALGYFIVEEYPLIKDDSTEPFAQVVGTARTIELEDGDRIVSARITAADLEEIKQQQKTQDDIEHERRMEMELSFEHKELSIADHFRQRGMWNLNNR